MPKKTPSAAPPSPAAAEGLPHPDSVIETVEMVSPKGNKYTILKTTETDATDRRPKPKKKK